MCQMRNTGEKHKICNLSDFIIVLIPNYLYSP